MMTMRTLLCMFFIAASPPLLFAATPAEELSFWNDEALSIVRMDLVSPPKMSRAMAILHIAIFDAVNAVEREYEPYLFDAAVLEPVDLRAAVATASREVLRRVYPTFSSLIDEAYVDRMVQVPDGASKSAGIALGLASAQGILLSRSADRSGAETLTAKDIPGSWVPTPPNFAAPLLPSWGAVIPFSMTQPAQFRKSGPPALDSTAWLEALDEVRRIGGIDSTERTAAQTEIADFWADGPATSTPPGHWNRIALGICDSQGLSFYQRARLMALLNIVMADAAIAAWDMKYHYYFWRPVTALAEVDPDWRSLIVTPPFPEYVSGHSTFSGAAAELLSLYFKRDALAFDSTTDEGSLTRHYEGFAAAAREAGMSRIYGGIHFGFSSRDGLLTGREIARQAWFTRLRPLRAVRKALVSPWARTMILPGNVIAADDIAYVLIASGTVPPGSATGARLFHRAFLDGAEITLEPVGPTLFAYTTPLLPLGLHRLRVKTYLEQGPRVDALNGRLTETRAEILTVQNDLALEDDATRRGALLRRLSILRGFEQGLLQQLDAVRILEDDEIQIIEARVGGL